LSHWALLLLGTTRNCVIIHSYVSYRNPTLKECEDDTHTSEMGTWESSGTLENSEFDCRGQNTSPWGFLYTLGKVLKCRCRKWPLMSHSDIYNTSYGWKPTTKSRESTQPRCVQVECNTPLESSQGELQVCFRPHPNRRFEQGVMNSQSPKSPNRDNFGTPPWSPRRKCHWDVGATGKCREYYMGKGGGFPWVRAMVSHVSLGLLVTCLSIESVLECELTNLLVSLMQVWITK
jgi:hypothetical protein